MPLLALLRAALLLACAAPRRSAAVEVSYAEHPPPAELPSFASGTDVFGRAAPCRACHALLQNLQGTLIPRLAAQMQRDARRRASASTPGARRVEFGAYEGMTALRTALPPLIQDDVPRGCLFSTTYHDREVRRACDALLEAHEDAISDVFQRWVQAGGEAAAGWSWNAELCWHATRGACPEPLAVRPLSDFSDDGSGAAERTYRSETVPPAGTRQDGLLVAVAASLHSAVAGAAVAETDVLLYAFFPRSAPQSHAAALPAVRAAAALLRDALGVGGASLFEAVLLDGDRNDAPPPHGTGLRVPALALYSARAKAAPRYLERFAQDGGQVTLYDVLYFIAAAAGRRDTAEAAAALLRTTPDEQLTARPWEEEAGDDEAVQDGEL